jgi:hypothetical protein
MEEDRRQIESKKMKSKKMNDKKIDGKTMGKWASSYIMGQ